MNIKININYMNIKINIIRIILFVLINLW